MSQCTKRWIRTKQGKLFKRSLLLFQQIYSNLITASKKGIKPLYSSTLESKVDSWAGAWLTFQECCCVWLFQFDASMVKSALDGASCYGSPPSYLSTQCVVFLWRRWLLISLITIGRQPVLLHRFPVHRSNQHNIWNWLICSCYCFMNS